MAYLRRSVLAKRFKVSLSFVQRLIRLYENTGQVSPKHHGGGAIAKIQVEDLPLVQQLVSEQPDALLVELCERLALRRGLQVSVPTMHRTVQKLGLTTKKKRFTPANKIVHESNGCVLNIGIGY
ncbi:transposase [Brasilonema sp. CT11]|nr:transposase [Brasilonema sp. CT11]